MSRSFAILIASVAFASYAAAEEAHQPYKGFEARDITSLSDQDIAALQEGSGWGLALPAELNGYPGPAHVLELASELDLSDEQKQRVTSIFEAMRAEAINKGEALIQAEQRLDQGFKSGELDESTLKQLIEDAEEARANLRFVHLSRHLMTLEFLENDQVTAYSILRGYSNDPCASVPDGHDATMWRRHNGCGDQ